MTAEVVNNRGLWRRIICEPEAEKRRSNVFGTTFYNILLGPNEHLHNLEVVIRKP